MPLTQINATNKKENIDSNEQFFACFFFVFCCSHWPGVKVDAVCMRPSLGMCVRTTKQKYTSTDGASLKMYTHKMYCTKTYAHIYITF